jgi:hypothetical protein
MMLGILLANGELDALTHRSQYFVLLGIEASVILALWVMNRVHARSAVLYFEELPPEILTRLGLLYVPPPQSSAAQTALETGRSSR